MCASRPIFFAFVLLACLASGNVFAKGGGSLPPACSATPPTQATALSLTSLKMCDTLATNHGIDVNNTGNPGYTFYTQEVAGTTGVTPAANILNDGTGTQIAGSGTSQTGNAFQTATRAASPQPAYIGTAFSGSYYAEIDMKFNPVQPSGQIYGNTPAFWAYNSITSWYNPPISSNYPTTEVDIFEALPAGGTGTNITPNFQLHEWTWNSGTSSPTNTACNPDYEPTIAALPGNPNLNNYHTYGFLFKRAADNGGTATLQWYFDNTKIFFCAYTVGGSPTCNGFSIGCPVGTFNEMETQPTQFLVGTGNFPWPNTVRNFHVWQL